MYYDDYIKEIKYNILVGTERSLSLQKASLFHRSTYLFCAGLFYWEFTNDKRLQRNMDTKRNMVG